MIDLTAPGVFLYDSMGGYNMPALSAILSYLRNEHLKKKGTVLDVKHFAKEVAECPRQTNNNDCGVFILKVAEFIARKSPLSFVQENISYFRRSILWEIKNNQLNHNY